MYAQNAPPGPFSSRNSFAFSLIKRPVDHAGKELEKFREFGLIFKTDRDNIKTSIVVGNAAWHLTPRWSFKETTKCLRVDISCNDDNISNLWYCDAEIRIELVKADKSFSEVKQLRNQFTRSHRHLAFDTLSINEILANGYIGGGEIRLRVAIDVKSTTGIQNAQILDFTDSKNTESEICIVLKDVWRFYVDKHILIAFSPVFRSMLLSDFSEKNSDEIPMKDITYDEMKCFVNILYQTSQEVNSKNVRSLLRLADRFLVDFVMRKCENFLCHCKVTLISRDEKLKIAEEHNFSKLQKHTLESITTIAEMQELFPNVHDLGQKTTKAILERVFALNNPYKVQRKRKMDSSPSGGLLPQ